MQENLIEVNFFMFTFFPSCRYSCVALVIVAAVVVGVAVVTVNVYIAY